MRAPDGVRRCVVACTEAETACHACQKAVAFQPGMADCSHACHEAHKECRQFLAALHEGSLAGAVHCADMLARAASQCERHPDQPACVRCAEVCRRVEAELRTVA